MISLRPIASSAPLPRSPADARLLAAGTSTVAADRDAASRLRATSIESPRPLQADATSASTDSLMRTASEQLDQFDRVLEKLRAELAPAATYRAGGAAAYGAGAGRTGLVVDRLA